MGRSLESDLRAALRGEVRFGNGDRALYAADASNYREVPRGVVVPADIDDLAEAVRVCARHDAAVLHRGGGTSLAGQTVCEGAVVIDSSKHCHRILSVDGDKRLATVEPGVVLDDLRHAANVFGLTFGPDPATHNHNTLGGMLGNNSCGEHSLYAGRTVDNVRALDILTYDGVQMSVGATPPDRLLALATQPGRIGEIYSALIVLRDAYADEIRARYPKIPRRVSGYSLDELLPEKGFHLARALVGSEGTCVTLLRATLELVDDPPCKALLVIGFESIEAAADAVPHILPHRKHGLIALEGLGEELILSMRHKHYRVEDLKYLPDGKGWLMAQFAAATHEDAEAAARELWHDIRRSSVDARLVTDPDHAKRLWEVREAGLGSASWVPGMRDTWPGWEDSAVAPENLGAYMRDLKALFARFGYKGAMYGHFGDGLIHVRVDFGLHSPEEVKRFRAFEEAAAVLVVRHGGSLSGEHGDGRARAELLPIMYGERLVEAFARFKAIWDPRGRMNPGRMVTPKPLDTDLRYGPAFERRKPAIHTLLKFPESENRFDRAVMRCVGVGECRRHSGGTMCPSFRGTGEEKHTTRGRARLLQELLERGPIEDGFGSIEVRQALDLCLSCKACKTECPVGVDMASYRAEFLYHHFRKHPRPWTAQTLGRVHQWAPLAAAAPWLFNALTQAPGFSAAAKWAAGVHPARTLPRLAGRTFRRQWRPQEGPRPVRALLWADTFNNHFTPEPLLAAAEVLARSGFEVALPAAGLCCGRPFYDFGRLPQAKAYLLRILEQVAPQLDERTWLVVQEPSCLSVFRDDALHLFPDDDRARRLAERAVGLAEFLVANGQAPLRLDRPVAVHGHCHQKSVLGLDAEHKLLGDKARFLDDGCCGMAGAFGYERDKYAVSEAIARQGVAAHLKDLEPEAVVVADGFSCRHQIAAFTSRRAISWPELWLRAMG